jgi:hypothetical protein
MRRPQLQDVLVLGWIFGLQQAGVARALDVHEAGDPKAQRGSA